MSHNERKSRVLTGTFKVSESCRIRSNCTSIVCRFATFILDGKSKVNIKELLHLLWGTEVDVFFKDAIESFLDFIHFLLCEASYFLSTILVDEDALELEHNGGVDLGHFKHEDFSETLCFNFVLKSLVNAIGVGAVSGVVKAIVVAASMFPRWDC